MRSTITHLLLYYNTRSIIYPQLTWWYPVTIQELINKTRRLPEQDQQQQNGKEDNRDEGTSKVLHLS